MPRPTLFLPQVLIVAWGGEIHYNDSFGRLRNVAQISHSTFHFPLSKVVFSLFIYIYIQLVIYILEKTRNDLGRMKHLALLNNKSQLESIATSWPHQLNLPDWTSNGRGPSRPCNSLQSANGVVRGSKSRQTSGFNSSEKRTPIRERRNRGGVAEQPAS